ncbi:nuclear transport factor 2 family protein [Dyadobacter bucti]|uniref:nuclear transport factor 2 family protein n=1 Tax=Dyadobacter bucti TaxID=2572203 RepID=UPI001109778C|nr:nuclear transport factor 2 family protein [Dyadobacter bucti]
MNNKQILETANAAITQGDYEGFLAYCTDDTVWTFVGEQILQGKEAVRQYMAATYLEPPKFMVKNLIADGDFVTALGEIALKDAHGEVSGYTYCDVWRFRDGKMAELTAFVIESK